MEFRHNIPVGTKIDCVKIIGTNGDSCPGATRYAEVFLVADNAYGVLDLSLVAIPEGYERTGDKPEEWFRIPKEGEYYLCCIALVANLFYDRHQDFKGNRIILRKKATKKRFIVVDYGLPLGDYIVHSVNVLTASKSHNNHCSVVLPFRIEEREVA